MSWSRRENLGSLKLPCHVRIRKSGCGYPHLPVTEKRKAREYTPKGGIDTPTQSVLFLAYFSLSFHLQEHPIPIKMLLILHSFALISFSLSIDFFSVVVVGEIPTTLDGPFDPVTVPFDDRFRGNAVDLPPTDPRVVRRSKDFDPEQISVSLSATYDSVWISWITGLFLFLLLY